MPEDTTTTEKEVDDIDLDADRDALVQEISNDGDAADGGATEDQESAAVASARAEANAAAKALREAEARDLFDRRVAAYREMPEGQRDGFLSTSFRGEDAREEFVEQVAAIERTERVNALVEGNTSDEDLLAAYRDGDELFRDELEAAIAGDADKLRMLLSRVNENVVSLPEQEVAEGEEPVVIDWQARWLEGPIAETVEDLDVFNAEAIADIKKGRIQVTPEVREQLDGFLHEADRYPDGHSYRVKALQAAAGLASWARAEHEANVPFGLGGVQSTKHYQAPDGSWRQLEIDGRGMKRDTAIEDPVFASDAELYKEGPDAPEPFDPDSVRTLADARALSPDNWARLREADPEKAEALLRSESASKEEERMLEMRRGQL